MEDRHISHVDDVESGPQGDLRNRQDTDEYTALDRYISTLRDSRQLSISSQTNGDVPENERVPWWAPWRYFAKRLGKKDGDGDGDGIIPVPEAWLDTDWSQ